MRRSSWIVLMGMGVSLACLVKSAPAKLLINGLPNIADARLHAWYDGDQALGADGVAETPVWPNRQGDPDRRIANGYGVDGRILSPIDGENGHKALQYFDVVTWQDAGPWGTVDDGFTVFVAATVRDKDRAYFFTGNQGGGGAEANANYQADELDTWTMKGDEGRILTGPVEVDVFQLHTFRFGADGVGSHFINGSLVGSGQVGSASLEGFVLGGRQNGNERASVDFSEVLVYNEDLVDADRSQIETYLQTKFFSAGTPGDYNGDNLLTADDIDLLSTAVRTQSTDTKFDANKDGRVTAVDRDTWVESLKKTYYGDATLDGQFNTEDFVAVFQTGEYEDGPVGNSGWADGDWDGDGDFTSGDFVAAFQSGAYEQGPRTAVRAVPEPTTGVLLVGAAAMLIVTRRRR